MATSHAAPPQSRVDPLDNRRRIFIAANLGWGLDGFDFTMLALASSAIIATLGISVADFGLVTAVSVICSALGGILGGLMADRYGRVTLLVVSMVGFSVFTALTAASWGLVPFLVFRGLEGIFFGAEWAVGAALVAEVAKAERRGRTMGLLQGSWAIGWAASILVYGGLQAVVEPGTAWRLLFLIGIVPAFVAIWIRRSVTEPIDRAELGAKPALADLFRGPVPVRRITITLTIQKLGGMGLYYAVVTYMPLWLQSERGLSVGKTTVTLLAMVAANYVGYVTSGFVHDWLGRRVTFTLFYLGSASAASALMLIESTGPATLVVVSCVLGYFSGAATGSVGAYLAENFPTRVRASGMGFTYNLGRGLSAASPAYIGFAAAAMGLGPAIAVTAAAGGLLAIGALWTLPETKGKDITADV